MFGTSPPITWKYLKSFSTEFSTTQKYGKNVIVGPSKPKQCSL